MGVNWVDLPPETEDLLVNGTGAEAESAWRAFFQIQPTLIDNLVEIAQDWRPVETNANRG